VTDTDVQAPPETTEPARQTGLARQSLGLLVASVAGNVAFFVSSLIIARSLGPSGRGVIAFFIVSVLIGCRLVSVGTAESTAVAAGRYPDRRAAILSQALGLSLVFGLVGGALLAGLLALARGLLPQEIDGVIIVLIGIGTLVNTVFLVAFGYLRGCSRFKAYGGVLALSPWVYAICLAVLWTRHDLTITSVAVVWVVYSSATAVAAVAMSIPVAGLSRPDPRLVRESLGFGVRAWPGSLSSMVNARIDQVIMGFITTAAVLGFYSVAVNVSEILLYLPSATAAALLPALLRKAADERVAETLSVLRRLILVMLTVTIVAAAVGAPLIPLVFGDAFRSSVAPYLLLLPSGIGFAALLVSEAGLLAAGTPVRASLTMVVAVVTGIVLDFLLVPKLGANGASIAASAAWLAGGTLGVLFLRRRGRVPWRGLIPGRSDVLGVVATARTTMSSLAASRT
jgi:O-antigen/teichoic acid export membrane protein